MTKLSLSPSAKLPVRTASLPLYRDMPLTGSSTSAVVRLAEPGTSRLVLPVQTVAERLLFAGFAVLTLPVVAYSGAQLWKLIASGSLDRAVAAFVP